MGKHLRVAVGVGLRDVGAVGYLDLVAAVQVRAQVVGFIAVHLCGATRAFTLAHNRPVNRNVVAGRYRNQVAVQDARNRALVAGNGYLVAVERYLHGLCVHPVGEAEYAANGNHGNNSKGDKALAREEVGLLLLGAVVAHVACSAVGRSVGHAVAIA